MKITITFRKTYYDCHSWEMQEAVATGYTLQWGSPLCMRTFFYIQHESLWKKPVLVFTFWIFKKLSPCCEDNNKETQHKSKINSLPLLKFPQMVSHKSKQLQSAINSMLSSKFHYISMALSVASCILLTASSLVRYTSSLDCIKLGEVVPQSIISSDQYVHLLVRQNELEL